MQTDILKGRVVGRSKRVPALFMELDTPVAGRKYAVFNYDTRGYRKLHMWQADDRGDVEVFYKVGPDALMVIEV